MRRIALFALLSAPVLLGACASKVQDEVDLTAAYDVAASAEAAYAADPGADPALVKQAAALLASAQAALLAWQNAPAGSTTEATALSAAVAALVAFEAQIGQAPATLHADRDCDPTDPTCDDGVHRG
jgi:hypothetical protein